MVIPGMSPQEETLIFAKCLGLITKTRKRVKEIDGANFPTNSSELARVLLLDALNALENPSFWPSVSPEALYNAVIHLQERVTELEASTNDHISWPLVSYCDHIWSALFPNNSANIFYSVTAEHNYIISSFSRAMESSLTTVLTNEQVNRLFKKPTLYCLKLASLEDENLPLYANIGHEFGHALFVAHLTDLITILETEFDSFLQSVAQLLLSQDSALAGKRMKRVGQIVIRLATELFCDLVGTAISGPAFFLSLQEMSWGTNQSVWTAVLSPQDEDTIAYPSFKFRLSLVRAAADIAGFTSRVRTESRDLFQDPLKSVLAHFTSIDSDHNADRFSVIAQNDPESDGPAIETILKATLPQLKASLSRFVQRCQTEFLSKFNSVQEFAAATEADIAKLLTRLSSHVLPNIVPDGSLLGRPATFKNILNASAIYRVHLLLQRDHRQPPGSQEVLSGEAVDQAQKRLAHETSRELQKVERLTAKAFEVSYVQRQFTTWKKDHSK